MAIYSYTALKNNREIVKGKIEAGNPREARENIRKLGFIPTKIEEDIVRGHQTAQQQEAESKETKKN